MTPAEMLAQLAAPATQPATGLGDIAALSGSGVNVEVTSDGNIVLTGDPKDLEILQQFVRKMDAQPVPTPKFEIYRLQAGQADALAAQLQQFWDKIKAPAKGGAIAAEDRLTIIAERRSNTLMIAASDQNMPQVLDIIKRLDQPSTLDVKFEAIQLKSIKAIEAETTLKALFQSRQSRLGGGGELFDIKADIRSNTLLISAPKGDMETIKNILSLIDVEPSTEPGQAVKLAFFPLQKAVANDLAKVLTEMLQANSDQTVAMKEQIRFKDGKVAATTWDDYPILRFHEVPEMDIQMIDAPNEAALGLGEASVGPTCAALGNAVARALGKRIRDMPLTRERIMATLLSEQ
jgi:hypothetical protein